MGPRWRVLAAIAAIQLVLALSPPARAAAAEPYDAEFVGESAFLTLDRGATGTFSVFWANTGSTEWTPSGVVLAVCKPDKTSCDQGDASTAALASGWLSASRYAGVTQDSVPPGKVGTFTFRVKVPTDAAAGTYRFFGSLWDTFGRKPIHNVGYFQDVVVTSANAATLTALTPVSGTDAGGDSATITGSGIACSPSPMVSFDKTPATVVTCGPGILTVLTPAHTEGSVNVTVTNAGATASNAFPFVYVDKTPPAFTSLDAVGQLLTLHFSEPVCVSGGTLRTSANESVVRVAFADVGSSGSGAVMNDRIAFSDCGTATTGDTATLEIDPTKRRIAPGDDVRVTLLAAGIARIQDRRGNLMANAQTRAAVALRDSTPPAIASAEVVGSTKLKVTWTKDMRCSIVGEPAFVFSSFDGQVRTNTSTTCSGAYGATVVIVSFAAGTFTTSTAGLLTYDPTQASASAQVVDTSGNAAGRQTIAAASYVASTIVTAKLDTDMGKAGVGDAGDVIRLQFSKDMQDTAGLASAQFWLEDADGTTVIVRCDPTLNASDGYIAADCVRNASNFKLFLVTLREATNVASDTQSPGTPGLAWPATIAAITGWLPVYSDLKPVDLNASADTTID